MKKNIAMRLAAILFILTMISTCAFSSTFAKYVTSDHIEDSARVAKWGVEVTIDKDTFFATSYAKDNTSVDTVGDNTVVSSSTDKLVAPGTKGVLTTITVKGTPEVAVDVKYEATVTLTGWSISTGEYCPIVIIIDSTEYRLDEDNDETVAAFAARVAKVITDKSCQKDANADLSQTTTIDWKWEFSTSDANDVRDTELGNLSTAPTIAIDITTTVTQID